MLGAMTWRIVGGGDARDALALMGLELKWANLASVLIGFMGQITSTP
ncbi:hypothetical protein M8494_03045 [Serratia ureilytica]